MLGRFHGGLKLPGHKALSVRTAIADAPAPQTVVIPVRQHIGRPADVLVKIGEQVGKGQKIAAAEGYISAPVHASISGTVTAIENRHTPHPSGLKTLCIEIESDGLDQWVSGLPAKVEDFQSLDAVQLRNLLRDAGIVGLGGAAFPTAVKLNPREPGSIHTVIVNGAECEPFITCDDLLMQEHAAEIISGIAIVQQLLKPQRVLIGIEDNKPQAIAKMQQAVAASNTTHIEVIPVPTIYPTGGEKQLIKVLTQTEVPSNGLPADLGISCHNVGSVFAIHNAIILGEPLIDRVVTLAGEGIDTPQNVRVRLGTLFADIVQFAGGYTKAADHLIMGGPMMGISLSHDELPVIKATNCLLIAAAQEIRQPAQVMPCIRCGQCADACPAQLLPQQLHWFAQAKDFDKIQEYNLFDCIECGCCDYVCPSHIPLVQYYRHAKTEIWLEEKQLGKSNIARERFEFREARLERKKREKAERLAKKRAALKAKNSDKEDPKKKAIEAALARAKAKQDARDAPPDNTQNLTAAQQDQIDEADARRKLAMASVEPAAPDSEQHNHKGNP